MYKGFTLLELLVTLVILGVLLGFGQTSFQSSWEKFQLDQASRELNFSLQNQKVISIINKKNRYISIENGIFYTNFQGEDKNIEPLNTSITYLYSTSKVICSSGEEGKPIAITFSYKGGATPRSICLEHTHFFRKLIISSYGKIRLTEISPKGSDFN